MIIIVIIVIIIVIFDEGAKLAMGVFSGALIHVDNHKGHINVRN